MNEVVTSSTLDGKLWMIVTDIYEAAVLQESTQLEQYMASSRFVPLFSADEYGGLLTYLVKQGYLDSAQPTPIILGGSYDPTMHMPPYDLSVNLPKVRALLGLDRASKGVRLHPTHSLLIINGKTVKLGRGIDERSLQYWICHFCLKKPSQPIQEVDILAEYDTGFETIARSRAVSDATRKLNHKIAAITGIDRLFIYSSGLVTFNTDKLPKLVT